MSELQIQRCARCGAHLFPERLRCPACGGLELVLTAAGGGAVEQETALRRVRPSEGGPIRLGSVRLAAGPVVIARLREGVAVGSQVRLARAGSGAVWAGSACAGPAIEEEEDE